MGGDQNTTHSKYYDTWINQGFVSFVGMCHRFSKQKNKEVINSSLVEFYEQSNAKSLTSMVWCP
jgi:hypothetical protein